MTENGINESSANMRELHRPRLDAPSILEAFGKQVWAQVSVLPLLVHCAHGDPREGRSPGCALGAWLRNSVRWRPREEDAPPGRRTLGVGRSPGYIHHHTIRPNTQHAIDQVRV